MLSAVIKTRHSYPAMPLARQQVDQRSVHPGPLVVFIPLFTGAQTISSSVFAIMQNEDVGILPIGAVILYEMIPLPMSPRVFQRKSLRGQTKHFV